MLHRGHPNGGKSCIVLESRPTRSLVANVRRSQYANIILQASNPMNTGVCETDVGHLKHTRMITAELRGPTFNSLCTNLAWWAVTQRTSKIHKTVSGGGSLTYNYAPGLHYCAGSVIHIVE